jgi:hypothetical protein
MSINTKADPSNDLCTFIVAGKTPVDKMIREIELFYEQQPKCNVLWDFRYADFDAISFCNELKNFTCRIFKSDLKFQKMGRTAIVASADLWFGFAKLYAKFSDVENLHHFINIFRFMDEANNWLTVSNK